MQNFPDMVKPKKKSDTACMLYVNLVNIDINVIKMEN